MAPLILLWVLAFLLNRGQQLFKDAGHAWVAGARSLALASESCCLNASHTSKGG